MNRISKVVISTVLSTVSATLLSVPGLAQATGDSFTSGGAPGAFSSTPGQPTNQQAIDLPANRGVALPPTSYSLLAPKSVDMTPYPSDQFTYGFPIEAPAPYVGVDRGSFGGMLPPTSTASVNLNTVDCPFIRMPTEGNGIGTGTGTTTAGITGLGTTGLGTTGLGTTGLGTTGLGTTGLGTTGLGTTTTGNGTPVVPNFGQNPSVPLPPAILRKFPNGTGPPSPQSTTQALQSLQNFFGN